MLQILSGFLVASIILMWFKLQMIRVACHEVAHAVVGLCLGLKITEIKISEGGSGHVITFGARTNIKQKILSLAPYIFFIPFVLSLIIYLIINQFEQFKLTSEILLLIIGFTYAFQLKFLMKDLDCQFWSINKKGFNNQDLHKAGLMTSFISISLSHFVYIIILFLIGVSS